MVPGAGFGAGASVAGLSGDFFGSPSSRTGSAVGFVSGAHEWQQPHVHCFGAGSSGGHSAAAALSGAGRHSSTDCLNCSTPAATWVRTQSRTGPGTGSGGIAGATGSGAAAGIAGGTGDDDGVVGTTGADDANGAAGAGCPDGTAGWFPPTLMSTSALIFTFSAKPPAELPGGYGGTAAAGAAAALGAVLGVGAGLVAGAGAAAGATRASHSVAAGTAWTAFAGT